MEIIPVLKDAASKIGSGSIFEELCAIETRLSSPDVPVMIPLVGEYDSGKTSLINALTDSKALETAATPTTATIFEVHFGAPDNYAEILRDNGGVEMVDDISSLKNDKLTDTAVVTIHDKSSQVSPSTILVDTPGISSPNPKHQQVLVDFLPQADSLLLVIDINQQLTQSLSNFISSTNLSDVELNVVLTKSEVKSKADIEAAKQYFIDHCGFKFNRIVAVSAHARDLDQLHELFNDIALRKSEILKKSANARLKTISKQILSIIENLLKASADTTALESEINANKSKLVKIKEQIGRCMTTVTDKIDDLTRSYCRKFEDESLNRLSAIVNSGSNNYDAEAVAAINTIAGTMIGAYRQKVMQLLTEQANKSLFNDEFSLACITGIDLTSIGIQGLSYNLDLNNKGHEYDKWIKGGIIVAAAAATIGAAVATGGASAAATASGAVSAEAMLNMADTATDVGTIIANREYIRRIDRVVRYGQQVADQYVNIDNMNNTGINDSGVGKGLIDSIVGLIVEKTMSKPQRRYAVRTYIDGSLAPEFESRLSQAQDNIIATIRTVLTEAAQKSMNEINAQLKRLSDEMSSNKKAADEKMAELKALRAKIITH